MQLLIPWITMVEFIPHVSVPSLTAALLCGSGLVLRSAREKEHDDRIFAHRQPVHRGVVRHVLFDDLSIHVRGLAIFWLRHGRVLCRHDPQHGLRLSLSRQFRQGPNGLPYAPPSTSFT